MRKHLPAEGEEASTTEGKIYAVSVVQELLHTIEVRAQSADQAIARAEAMADHGEMDWHWTPFYSHPDYIAVSTDPMKTMASWIRDGELKPVPPKLAPKWGGYEGALLDAISLIREKRRNRVATCCGCLDDALDALDNLHDAWRKNAYPHANDTKEEK